MALSVGRSVVVISGLLTLLVLGGGALAVGFHNGWLRTVGDPPRRETAVASAQPTPAGNDRDALPRLAEPSPAPSTSGAIQDQVGVYRQKLEEAYRALDDAYAQIRTLQSAPPVLASGRRRRAPGSGSRSCSASSTCIGAQSGSTRRRRPLGYRS